MNQYHHLRKIKGLTTLTTIKHNQKLTSIYAEVFHLFMNLNIEKVQIVILCLVPTSCFSLLFVSGTRIKGGQRLKKERSINNKMNNSLFHYFRLL